MLKGECGQRRTAKIGVQNNAGGIDDGTQGVTQILTHLPLNGIRNAGQRNIHSRGIETPGGNLLAQTAEHESAGFCNRTRAVLED